MKAACVPFYEVISRRFEEVRPSLMNTLFLAVEFMPVQHGGRVLGHQGFGFLMFTKYAMFTML
jgi:hypothetical protein